MLDTLQQICETKKQHIAERKKQRPEVSLLADAQAAPLPRGFRQALIRNQAETGLALIAEIKKASPSKGIIRTDFHPAQLAEAYTEGGAACLSVLTDTPYFQGADTYIAEAQAACELPVLRKDFMLEPYQIIESRALGADCVLLIIAALQKHQAKELYDTARQLDMDVLVEVHNEHELELACTHIEPDMLGINNRDLKTLKIDLNTSARLAKYVPQGTLTVGESGLHTHEHLLELKKHGISCYLVGESLMLQNDVAQATRELLGNAHA